MDIRRRWGWALGCLLILTLVLVGGRQQLFESFAAIPAHVLAVLLVFQAATLAGCAWQWTALLRSAGGTVSFAKVFQIYMAGAFGESVTPSVKFGGEAVKVFLYRRYAGLTGSAIGGVLAAQKFLMMVPFFLLTALLVAYHASLWQLSAGGRALAGVGGAAALVLLVLSLRKQTWKRTGSFFRDMGQTACSLTGTCGLPVAMVSVLIWLGYPLKVHLLAVWGLDLPLSFSVTAAVVLAAYLAGLVPLLPGGLGAFEAVMAGGFAAAGLEPAEGLALALASRMVTFWIPLVVSGLTVASMHWRMGSAARHTMEEDARNG